LIFTPKECNVYSGEFLGSAFTPEE